MRQFVWKLDKDTEWDWGFAVLWQERNWKLNLNETFSFNFSVVLRKRTDWVRDRAYLVQTPAQHQKWLFPVDSHKQDLFLQSDQPHSLAQLLFTKTVTVPWIFRCCHYVHKGSLWGLSFTHLKQPKTSCIWKFPTEMGWSYWRRGYHINSSFGKHALLSVKEGLLQEASPGSIPFYSSSRWQYEVNLKS